MSGELMKAIADLEENEALRITREKLDHGEEPHSILEESRNGMEIVGKRSTFGTGSDRGHRLELTVENVELDLESRCSPLGIALAS